MVAHLQGTGYAHRQARVVKGGDMLDDINKLRNIEDDDDHFSFDNFDPESDANVIDDLDDSGGGRPFLGMSPVERMFLSIFLFMNVVVLGLALLLATGRMQF